VPYSFLRKKIEVSKLTPPLRVRIASYTPLHILLWFYEELVCNDIDVEIAKRLEAGEDAELGFGKLMELLITTVKPSSPVREPLMKLAEKMRESVKLPIDGPLLVIGDASSSMNVAVRTAVIIAGFVASLVPKGQAELRFFTSVLKPAPYVPTTMAEILDVASKVKAEGMTTNAAGLLDVYEQRRVFRTVLMVTDEDENGTVTIKKELQNKDNTGSLNFGQLFAIYQRDVFRAKLVFVSFLNQTDQGKMCTQLKKAGIEHSQLRFDPKRPDLSKLDALLGMLAASSSQFDGSVLEKQAALEKAAASASATSSSSSSSSSATAAPAAPAAP